MPLTQTQLKTAADYDRLAEGAPVQLIAGEFIISPSPLFIHQKISLYLSKRLDDFVIERGLGEVCPAPFDVYLTDRDIYQPDILFVSKGHLNWIETNACYGPPDFVIEILSPSTAYYDLHRKKDAYEKFGVREYWIVDPMEESIETFVNSSNGYRTNFLGKAGKVCSSVLPEFCVEVEKVFVRR